MKLAILTLCTLLAVGVGSAMFLAIWSSSGEGSRPLTARRDLAMRFVWTAIPCLTLLAAAIPATIAIAGSWVPEMSPASPMQIAASRLPDVSQTSPRR